MPPRIVTHALATLTVAGIVFGLGAAPGHAQWPSIETPGIPRLEDGSVDLDAPAPRTPWGTPDFSGLWGRAPREGGPFDPPPPPPPGTPPLATFFEVGAGLPGGKPPFTPWGAAVREEREAANSRENPDALCLPMGHMQFHLHGQPRRVMQQPDVMAFIYEANYGLRFVYLDGRPLPAQGEPQPWWYGYSVGRWEGDELVIETNNLRNDGWLDVRGSPLTDQATITERIRRPSFGRLEIDYTVSDPKAYTEPWTVRINQQILVDSSILEFICNENQQFGRRVTPD